MSKKQFYWYYSNWLKTIGWYYRVPGKFARQIDLFLKICKEHSINPYAFLDFMFIWHKGVYPFGIHKIKMKFYNEFLDKHDNKSLLELYKEDIEKERQVVKMYRKMGISDDEIILLLRYSPLLNLSSNRRIKYQIFNFIYGVHNMKLFNKFFGIKRGYKRNSKKKEVKHESSQDVVY